MAGGHHFRFGVWADSQQVVSLMQHWPWANKLIVQPGMESS